MPNLIDGSHFMLEINGTRYYWRLTDVRVYQQSDQSPFTSRSAVGGLTLADYDQVGAVEQRTFAGGMGQAELKDLNRYRYTTYLDTRTPGVVSLSTRRGSVTVSGITNNPTTTTGTLNKGSGATDYFIMGGTGGVFVWDGTTLTNISSGLPTTNVNEVWYNGVSLFAGMQGTDSIYRFTGSVAAPSWTVANAGNDPVSNAACFCVHNGYFFVAEQDTQSNLVHYAALADLSDFEGNTSDTEHLMYSATGDVDAIEVGPPGYVVKRLISYGGTLFACRLDGIWTVQLEANFSNPASGSFVSYKRFDFSRDLDATNFNMCAVFNDALYFNIGKRIYRYAGSGTGGTLLDVTPAGYTVTHPPTYDYPAKCGVMRGGTLYTVIGDNLYGLSNGETWHRFSFVGGTPTTEAAIGYYPGAPDYGRICVLHSSGSSSVLYHWRADDDFARVPYETNTGTLYTSLFDGGFINVPKHFHSLKLFGYIPTIGGSISATAYVLNEEGQVDTYTLGSFSRADIDPNVVNEGGITDITSRRVVDLRFPRTAVGRAVLLRFQFVLEGTHATTSASPQLFGYVLEYVPRPPTIFGYNVQVPVSDYEVYTDGRTDPLTFAEKYNLLKDARDSKTPLEFEDFLGNSGTVYVSAILTQPREWTSPQLPNGAGAPNVVVTMSLMQLTRGCIDTFIDDDITIYGEYAVSCTVHINATLTLEEVP